MRVFCLCRRLHPPAPSNNLLCTNVVSTNARSSKPSLSRSFFPPFFPLRFSFYLFLTDSCSEKYSFDDESLSEKFFSLRIFRRCLPCTKWVTFNFVLLPTGIGTSTRWSHLWIIFSWFSTICAMNRWFSNYILLWNFMNFFNIYSALMMW